MTLTYRTVHRTNRKFIKRMPRKHYTLKQQTVVANVYALLQLYKIKFSRTVNQVLCFIFPVNNTEIARTACSCNRNFTSTTFLFFYKWKGGPANILTIHSVNDKIKLGQSRLFSTRAIFRNWWHLPSLSAFVASFGGNRCNLVCVKRLFLFLLDDTYGIWWLVGIQCKILKQNLLVTY